MAKLSGPFKFIGMLDDVNAYKLKNVDETIIRRKPGPTSHQVKTDPSFERTLENASDFRGASAFSVQIRHAAWGLRNLTYSYLHGQLTALGTRLSDLDYEHVRGQRSVAISKYHHVLTDYDLNPPSPFNSTLRAKMPYSIDRETCTALIHIPELWPRIQLQAPPKYPFFRLRFELGVVSDVIWDEGSFRAATDEHEMVSAWADTAWHACSQKREADDISITLSLKTPLQECESLALYAGIEWGVPQDVHVIKTVPKAGCAKIMGLA